MQSPNHAGSYLWPWGRTHTQTYLHESDFKSIFEGNIYLGEAVIKRNGDLNF